MQDHCVRQALAAFRSPVARQRRNSCWTAALVLALVVAAPPGATGQEAALAWDQVKYYQYNILNVSTVSNADGTKTMAEAYLNSGHDGLANAAKQWSLSNGYIILSGQGAAPVRWGAW